jgi:hypothetical protein
MKATMEIPDELYRLVKAKSALEGRAVREVAVDLFRRYVSDKATDADRVRSPQEPALIDGEPAPPWFGILRKSAQTVQHHDMESIRESIAKGIAAERGY